MNYFPKITAPRNSLHSDKSTPVYTTTHKLNMKQAFLRKISRNVLMLTEERCTRSKTIKKIYYKITDLLQLICAQIH